MEYFTDKEFACKCGCGYSQVDVEFRRRLNLARHFSGVPYHINSGCRCDAHNKAEGGKEWSAHKFGKGVDIRVLTSRERFKILFGLLSAGFKRIGVHKEFIHADDMKSELHGTEVVWLY